MIAQPPPPALLMTPAERRRWRLSLWRYAAPALMAMAMVVVMLAPVPLPVPAMPHLALLCVLVWALLQPALMQPWAAFLIGLVADLAFGQPLGVNATLFALATAAMRLARGGPAAPLSSTLSAALSATTSPLGRDWLVAALVLAGALALTGPLMALGGRPVAVQPLGWQWLTSVLAWPIMMRSCAHVQRRLAATAPRWRHG